MKSEDLLAEFEDLIRSMPDRATLHWQESDQLDWLARASALVHESSPTGALEALSFDALMSNLHSHNGVASATAASKMVIMLKRIRYQLLLQTRGSQVAVHSQGSVFDYFDSVRRVIELATQDLLFVDPYMEAEFVGRYLPHAKAGTALRLMTGTGEKKLSALIPAAHLFASQSGMSVEVRSSKGLHDRFVFVDRKECHLSGASFKDGAKNAPAIVAQIVDGAGDLLRTYEDLWAKATIVPLA